MTSRKRPVRPPKPSGSPHTDPLADVLPFSEDYARTALEEWVRRNAEDHDVKRLPQLSRLIRQAQAAGMDTDTIGAIVESGWVR
ncbi:MAG TPA: hypothetical protein VN845_04585 [Solirubrobacteraceae bacterium]|nr:hypothetical protein [Solirubrobacteraceae bacterium]